jgi:glycosyltransferase involved in cell wall biosynthesis
VIQSGHDLSWLGLDLQKTPSKRVRFGYIGQVVPTKGVHILVSAFDSPALKDRAELHIYGNQYLVPHYYEQLQEQAKVNKDAVYYHGEFPHEQLGTILANIDILIVPSIWHENNPRVIQEAFASKTPVIASYVGGIAEYIEHGCNGYLFKRGDGNDLRSYLEQVVNNPEQMELFLAHLPEVKSIREEMDSIEAIYQQLLAQSEANKL